MKSIGRAYDSDLVKLPKELRGYVRYIVVLNPADGKPYSLGVKYVCETEGSQNLLAYLKRNVNRKHKKHVHSWLCQSVADGCYQDCELHKQCPNIHVTAEGFHGRRNWLRPLKGATCDTDTSSVGHSEEHSDDTESILTESTGIFSWTISTEPLEALASREETLLAGLLRENDAGFFEGSTLPHGHFTWDRPPSPVSSHSPYGESSTPKFLNTWESILVSESAPVGAHEHFLRELTVKQERLNHTRAKLHSAVDFILARESNNPTCARGQRLAIMVRPPAGIRLAPQFGIPQPPHPLLSV